MTEERKVLIQLKDIVKSYRNGDQELQVLKGIDLTVYEGEFLAIMGPSGSGKSTLMNIIGLLDRPTSGDYSLNGTQVEDLKEKELAKVRNEEIGFVFQQFFLLSKLNALQNVELPLIYAGIGVSKRHQLAKQFLDKVDLGERMKHLPSELSGGQKQRVAIAGAIAMRPNIIILDEATSMLDPEGRLELIQTIKEIRDQYNMTVISITHDLDEVALSDRVLVMKRGKVESSSTPRELFARGEELLTLGLDIPFSANLISTLKNKGFEFTANYLTEKELEDQLWELLLKA